MNKKKYPLIIPTIPRDFIRTKRDLNLFFDFLPICEIIFIGPDGLEELVSQEKNKYSYCHKIEYLNENDILSFSCVMEAMSNHLQSGGYTMNENSRPGWYYQQFLKMAFSFRCTDEFYITWDADTIPLHKIYMFSDDNVPYLDVKGEYNPGYFKTIKKLLNIDKQIEKSFISEHMIFNTTYMKELINEIEKTDNAGVRFYEKIISCIDFDNMKLGFSEFETYGSWILSRHRKEYALRDWHSLRLGGYFLDGSESLGEDDISWLSEDFDAISFESYNKTVPELSAAFYNKDYRERFSAGVFYKMLLENGFFGNYENGMLKSENGNYFPV